MMAGTGFTGIEIIKVIKTGCECAQRVRNEWVSVCVCESECVL